ncbi:hypothetical protein KCMC57_64340 (plasmid) [Kitasatospora sp. CMC57]|uniref:Uncharacterized protein n=1 Tax=Kitasatospora sp. CMC57 TaxID=3231513 RepID=A0AB33K844_9ACTN
MTRRPVCGNDPQAQLTDGDRAAIADFKQYLAARKALPDSVASMGSEEWRVLGYDADAWSSIGPARATLEEARERQAQLAERHPGLPTAVVRKTVTYTIEEQP